MRTLLRTRHLVFFALLFAIPAASHAQVGVGVAITVAPPALPVYEQPPCPTEGFLWTPGYWAYGPRGYFWTPGLWLAPPHPGSELLRDGGDGQERKHFKGRAGLYER